jgi:flagellar biosynthetic protein FlhB
VADDAGDRTEQPTARRRTEAREEGRVPRSADLTASVGLAAAVLLLNLLGGRMLESLLNLVREIGAPASLDPRDLVIPLSRAAHATALMLLPFMALLLVATATGALAQFGLLLTGKRLKPDLNNISPLRGLKQLFSKQAVVRLLMGLLKMAIVGSLAYYTIRSELPPVLAAGALTPWGMLNLGATVLYTLALRLALLLLVLGLVDYLFQRYSLEQSLKMTKQEVRDEMKRMDGDPLIKRRQREAQMRVAMQRVQRDVPKADVVVTNPTEFAVALRYDEATMDAPRVVAKGQDYVALRIRQVAQQHGVPIVQRPPLARALYAQVRVGQDVPPTFYKAVAEVLAYVYQLSGRAARAG